MYESGIRSDYGLPFVPRAGFPGVPGTAATPVSEQCYPQRAPITEGERAYTHSGHQSRKGRENIHITGTNHGRGESIYP
eukprot:42993-Prorocentrum_minimum.AAC.1